MCVTEWVLNSRGILPHKQLTDSVLFVTWRLSFDLPVSILHALKEQREKLISISVDKESSAEDATDANAVIRDSDEYSDPNFLLYDELIGKYNLREHNLADEPYLDIIKQVIHQDDQCKYDLYAYCIMPNHVHVVLKPLPVIAHASCAEGGRGDRNYASVQATSAGGSRGDCNYDAAGVEIADNFVPQREYHKITEITRSIKSITAHRINKALQRSGKLWMADSYDLQGK